MMASCNSRAAKEVEEESATMGPNWLELPRDITANILKRLGVIEILKTARNVCPLWWYICKDPLMWRTIHMTKLRISPYELVKICRYAIQRSCGHLEDINFEHFGYDDLLKYIADCTSHLRRIRLANCLGVSNKGLSDFAKKLPLLEELDISFSLILTKESLEVIGQCCPLLKSLKYSKIIITGVKCDDDAFAIAKTMHKLCHLKIFGNLLTNVGLLAILDGCPRLESLDLGACRHVDLSGSLGKRCHEQIKDLVLPTDLLLPGDSYLGSTENWYGHSYTVADGGEYYLHFLCHYLSG